MSTLLPSIHNEAHAHHLLHHSLGCTCTQHCFQHCKQLNRQRLSQCIEAQPAGDVNGCGGPIGGQLVSTAALIGMSQMNQHSSYQPIPYQRQQQYPSYQPYHSNQPSMGSSSSAYQSSQNRSQYSPFAHQQQHHSTAYQQVPVSHQCSATYHQVPTYHQFPASHQLSTAYQQVPVSQQCLATYHQVPTYQQSPLLYQSLANSTNLQSSSNAYPNPVIQWAGIRNETSRYPPVNPLANSSMNPPVNLFPNSFTNPSLANTLVNVSMNPPEPQRPIRSSVIVNPTKSNVQESISRSIVSSVCPLINKSGDDQIESVQANGQVDFDYRNSFVDVSDAEEDDDQNDGKLVIDEQIREEVLEDVPAVDQKDSQGSESKDAQVDDLKSAQVDAMDYPTSSIVVITKPLEANYLSFEMKDSMNVILQDYSTSSSGPQPDKNQVSNWKVAQTDPLKLKLVRQADPSVDPLIHDLSMNPLVKPSLNPSAASSTQPKYQYYLEYNREYQRARRQRILATETPKQRETRLAKQRVSMRKYIRKRRANESIEQKLKRIENAREYREKLKMKNKNNNNNNNKTMKKN